MDKALNTLGICSCARKISYGETLLKNIKSKKVYLVVIASDASDNSKKKIIDKCNFYGCNHVICFSKESITRAIGRVEVVSSVGINDYNLAKKFKENLERKGGQNEEK